MHKQIWRKGLTVQQRPMRNIQNWWYANVRYLVAIKSTIQRILKSSSSTVMFSGNTKLGLMFPWRNTQRDQQWIGVPTNKNNAVVVVTTRVPKCPWHMAYHFNISSNVDVKLLPWKDELHMVLELGKTEINEPFKFTKSVV